MSRAVTGTGRAVASKPDSRESTSTAGSHPRARTRWNPNPEDVRKSVLKLVLTLVELIRRLMERQAMRRMENGTLHELAADFGLSPEDLNLDLGPLGRLI